MLSRKGNFASPEAISRFETPQKGITPLRRWVMTVTIAAIVAMLHSSTASAAVTGLTESIQGRGNKGFSFTPVDEWGDLLSFTMTARSSIDSTQPFNADAVGDAGTVYIEKGNMGAGVQNGFLKGSKGISGGGGDKDEELIFTYNNPVLLDSIVLALSEIEFGTGLNDKDDPVIFLSIAGSGVFGAAISENDIFSVSAFTSTGSKKGEINFGSFSTLLGSTAIDALKIRETNGHIYVTGLSEGSPPPIKPIPAPGACVLGAIGMGFVSWLRRRRTL